MNFLRIGGRIDPGLGPVPISKEIDKHDTWIPQPEAFNVANL
jgi:hypothetical protein